MMVKENLQNILLELPKNVQLVAVSKTKPIEMIKEAYDAGQRIFGENRAQELAEKAEALPNDIEWHMIGHLQRNKVKYIAPHVKMIHSIDSPRLLKEVNKQAQKCDRTIDVLLQFHIAREESKFGFSLEEVIDLLEDETFPKMENINVRGVMGMATFTENQEKVAEEFQALNNYFLVIQSRFFKFNEQFNIISMGMTNDYKIAIEEGSNMVRIGSAIFGAR
jgi:pyridoxal phosphate enzyme (YggS family)